MLSIQTVSAAKSSSIVAAILLGCVVVSGCSNKEQSAYRLAAQAQQQLDAGDVASARLSIDKALRERDDLVELHLLKARIELRGKSNEGAFVSYFNALSLDPVNQDALQSVAMLGLQTGHTAEAEDAAGKLLSLSPRNPSALLVKGLLALERSRFKEALAAADGILANAPTDEGAVILKARSLYMSGDPSEAKALVSRTVQLAGISPGLARIMLEIARADGDQAGMLQAFEALRAQREDDQQLTVDEANVRYKGGDMARAGELVLAGLTRDNVQPDQVARLIDLWREYDPAAPAGTSLPRLKNPSVREAVARYLVDRGRLVEAGALLPAGPGSADGLRSRILLGTGQMDAARRSAQAIIDRDSGQCDAQVTLAELALKAGDQTSAITHAQQAASECPLQPDGALIAARAYNAVSQTAQARRVYRDAINRSPADLTLHTSYVTWLMSSGDAEAAAAIARHLLRYTPNRISSWNLLLKACTGLPCRDDAAKGLVRARTSFFIDRRPDEQARRGLFATFGKGVSGQ